MVARAFLSAASAMFRCMVDPVVECRAAAARFEYLKEHAESPDVRELAAGLMQLTAALRAVADSEGGKLAMDWPWSITQNVEK
jgi:hypothetical protein